MSVYFVNCGDLRLIVEGRGIAGEWVVGDDALEFTGINGAMLCWVVRRSMVFIGGKNVKELLAWLPELVPWKEVMRGVAKRPTEMQALREETVRLNDRLWLKSRNMQVRWRQGYEDLQMVVAESGLIGKWCKYKDQGQFISNDGLSLIFDESALTVSLEGKDGREITKADLAQRLMFNDELLKFLREKSKAA